MSSELINELRNELRNVLRGRSNTISKDEIKDILDKYDSKDKIIIDKGFWDMNKVTNEKGLIPEMIDKYKFNSQFTKEERDELEKIKHDEFMKRFRELAKKSGKKKAEEEFRRRVK